jgi:hypothetical protein
MAIGQLATPRTYHLRLKGQSWLSRRIHLQILFVMLAAGMVAAETFREYPPALDKETAAQAVTIVVHDHTGHAVARMI